MEQAKQIANYLHGIGNEEDADYVMFMAASIENDELHITRLANERDELSAQVDRLREGIKLAHTEGRKNAGEKTSGGGFRWESSEAKKLYEETPIQAIAHIRADSVGPAIRTSLRNFANADMDDEDIRHFAEDYAQRIRNGEV